MLPTGRTGFTLLELLVTIAICLIVLSGIPLLLQPITEAQRFLHARNQFVTDLRLAALKARQSGAAVILTVANDGVTYWSGVHSLLIRELPESIRILPAEDSSERSLMVVFYPSGEAHGGRWVIQDSSRRSIITVDPLMGYVRVDDGS